MPGSPTPKPAILVVEDDFLIRASTVEMLADLGWTAHEADSPETALAALEAHPAIALLIVDLRLGAQDGRALAESAQTTRPELRIVIASGTELGAVPPGWVLLPKPFSTRELERAVDLALPTAKA